MVVQATQVLLATAPMEECVKRAQVVIVSEHSWHLIAPRPYKMHCLNSFAAVPTVTCPVVDVREVPDARSDEMFRVMQACTADQAGVINLAGLLTGLEALGAKRWTRIDTAAKVQKMRRARGGVK